MANIPSHRPSTIRQREELLADVTVLIDAEYASNLSLDVAARRVGASRRQIELSDTTFRAYLAAVRMERAADLIRTGHVTSRDAARRVGYSQPAQFAKAFQRHHGRTPSQFRMTARQTGRPGAPQHPH